MWVTIVISGALRGGASPGEPHERQSAADPHDVPQAGHDRGVDAERGVESQEPEQQIERASLRPGLERHHEQRVEDQGRQPTDEVGREVTRAHADAGKISQYSTMTMQRPRYSSPSAAKKRRRSPLQ